MSRMIRWKGGPRRLDLERTACFQFFTRQRITTLIVPGMAWLSKCAIRRYSSNPGDTLAYIRGVMKRYPNAAVLTQIGGFFELIDEHAEIHGRRIGLDVRYRAIRGPQGQKYTAVSSFPVFSIDKYLERLIKREETSSYHKETLARRTKRKEDGLLISEPLHKSATIVILAQDDMLANKESLKRPIYQVLTPGTITDNVGTSGEVYNTLVEKARSQFCMAIRRDKRTNELGLAWADLTVGTLYYSSVNPGGLNGIEELSLEIGRISPKEILIELSEMGCQPKRDGTDTEALDWNEDEAEYEQDRKTEEAIDSNHTRQLAEPSGHAVAAKGTLNISRAAPSLSVLPLVDYLREELFGVHLVARKFPAARIQDYNHMFRSPIEAIHTMRHASHAQIKALCGLLSYCAENVCIGRTSFKFQKPVLEPAADEKLRMDVETRIALNISGSAGISNKKLEQAGSVNGQAVDVGLYLAPPVQTLVDYLSEAITDSGNRKIANWLASPLAQVDEVNRRLDLVSGLVEKPDLLDCLRNVLAIMPDGERALQGVLSYPPDMWRLKTVAQMAKTGQGVLSILQQRDVDGQAAVNTPLEPWIRALKLAGAMSDSLTLTILDTIGKVEEELREQREIEKRRQVRKDEVEDLQLEELENEVLMYDIDSERLLKLPEYVYDEEVGQGLDAAVAGEEYDYLKEFSYIAFGESNNDFDVDPTKRNPFAPTRRRIENPMVFRPCMNVDNHDDFRLEAQNIEAFKNSFKERCIQFQNKIQTIYRERIISGISKVQLVWHPRYLYCVRIQTATDQAQAELRQRFSVLNQNKTVSYILDPQWSEMGLLREVIVSKTADLEDRILQHFADSIKEKVEAYQTYVDVIAEVDAISNFGHLAVRDQLVRPKITSTTEFEIQDAWHPTVKRSIQQKRSRNLSAVSAEICEFQPNDCFLNCRKDSSLLWIVTGPNMGGKSTFIRQMGVLVIMAQTGSFVPASSASIGIVDRIFCRMGSGDDLYHGKSAFMVEMLETSHILNYATPRSLALMDEVGRGTSIEDGIALVYATIKHLVNFNKCRSLFATHFGKELQEELGASSPNISFYHSTVSDDGTVDNNEPPILNIDHRLRAGVTAESRGLTIARMAGFPVKYLR